MGNSCNLIQSISKEDNLQILSDIQYQGPAVKIPVFTRKLALNLKIDQEIQQIRPKRIDESVLEITTERNLNEQNSPQFYLINQIQFKKKEEPCQNNRRQKQQEEDLFQEICSNEVKSQISVHSKKEDEYEDYYYDLVRENEWDQFKFQPIFIMKMVDSYQQQQK